MKRSSTTGCLNKTIALAFILPVLICTLILISNEVYPFGDRCILRSDLYNQYVPFFRSFIRKIHGGENLSFDWSLGLGSNYFSMLAYYLASPFNYFVFLFPTQYLIEAMTLLIILKIGMIGALFAYYLRAHYGKDNLSIVLFSLFYSLSGFMIAYYWDVMWLDVVAFAPIVILCLERMVERGSTLPYILFLGFCILSNYYLSIFLCIYLVLDFIILNLGKKFTEILRNFLRFTYSSLLAAGLAGVLLVPAAIALSATKYIGSSFPQTVKFYFNLLEVIGRHTMDTTSELGLNHWPNLYSGIFVFILVPVYIMCRNIPKRERIAKSILVVFFWLSFSNNILNFIWHGLNYPDSLPCRQTFLYTFLLLTMAYEAYMQLEDISPRILYMGTIAGVFTLLATIPFKSTSQGVSTSSYVYSFLFLGMYLSIGIWYMHKEERVGRNRILFLIVTFCVVITEVAVNTALVSFPTTTRSKYVGQLADIDSLTDDIEEADPDFYRIEKFTRKTKNDGMLTDFKTASLFSSSAGEDIEKVYRQLGLGSSKVFYCYEGATPLTSALLNVRYMLESEGKYRDSDLHTYIGSSGDVDLYYCNYNLPVGYVIPADLEERWDFTDGDGIYAQNMMVHALGVEGILFHFLEEVPVESHDGTLTIPESGYIYAQLNTTKVKKLSYLRSGDEKQTDLKDIRYNYILDFGYNYAGSNIMLHTSDSDGEIPSVYMYRLDLEVLDQVMKKLSDTVLTDVTWTEQSLSGKVNMKETGKLVLAVPDDAGWTLWVDGVETTKETFMGSLLSVTLPEGEHEIHIYYEAPGRMKGLYLTLISAVLVGLVAFIQYRQKKNKQ
ncbi:MAG: YfhO family protein [Lachnospiraceae bacterium]|nr:YfhO family protein [Lachnospiraceae bacterium]